MFLVLHEASISINQENRRLTGRCQSIKYSLGYQYDSRGLGSPQQISSGQGCPEQRRYIWKYSRKYKHGKYSHGISGTLYFIIGQRKQV
ncbi:hypothetical protein [Pontibacter chinhatensis]|uniref:hypothetical protein n=1 Tax=Pontibacter chinhatensis TaxID=1436961 RepID=UPI001113BCA6|nr:hypothetical protein [Pontibacter chinhatensis]